MQQEHSHKMAHASMPSAKTQLKTCFWENEKPENRTETNRKN